MVLLSRPVHVWLEYGKDSVWTRENIPALTDCRYTYQPCSAITTGTRAHTMGAIAVDIVHYWQARGACCVYGRSVDEFTTISVINNVLHDSAAVMNIMYIMQIGVLWRARQTCLESFVCLRGPRDIWWSIENRMCGRAVFWVCWNSVRVFFSVSRKSQNKTEKNKKKKKPIKTAEFCSPPLTPSFATPPPSPLLPQPTVTTCIGTRRWLIVLGLKRTTPTHPSDLHVRVAVDRPSLDRQKKTTTRFTQWV